MEKANKEEKMKQLNELRKEPFTSAELFTCIVEKLKSNNELPDILDYSLECKHCATQILSEDFEFTCQLEFGASEGIYLHAFITSELNNDPVNVTPIGTFKTLAEDKESFRRMGVLEADFLWAAREFGYEHYDDFKWNGFDVYFFINDDTEAGYHYSGIPNKEYAMDLIEKELEKNFYKIAVLRDNKNRKDMVVRKKGLQ